MTDGAIGAACAHRRTLLRISFLRSCSCPYRRGRGDLMGTKSSRSLRPTTSHRRLRVMWRVSSARPPTEEQLQMRRRQCESSGYRAPRLPVAAPNQCLRGESVVHRSGRVDGCHGSQALRFNEKRNWHAINPMTLGSLPVASMARRRVEQLREKQYEAPYLRSSRPIHEEHTQACRRRRSECYNRLHRETVQVGFPLIGPVSSLETQSFGTSHQRRRIAVFHGYAKPVQ